MLDHANECDAAHVQPLCLPESAKALNCNTLLPGFPAPMRPCMGVSLSREGLFAGANFVKLEFSQENFFIHRTCPVIECIGEADGVTKLG